MTDQRQHPRYAIELDAELETASGTRVAGRTHDLSKGGFCMYTSAPVPVGTACRVHIALVFSATEFSESLELPATVVWCTPVQGQHQVGVKFAPLEATMRGYLDMFIKFLEPPDDGSDDDEGDQPGGGD